MNYEVKFVDGYNDGSVSTVTIKNVEAIAETYEHSGMMTFIKETSNEYIDIFICPKDRIIYKSN